MRALDRILVRDVLRMQGQLLAVSAVLACGVATLVLSLSLMSSLDRTQTDYYRQYRFAQLFARLRRAPLDLGDSLAKVPGVAQVQLRIVMDVPLDLPGDTAPSVGRLIALAPETDTHLNELVLRQGRLPSADATGEVLVSEAFAAAQNLQIGDSIHAIANGRRMKLAIVGVVLSPEYIFQMREGAGVPDDKHFGVIWMNYGELAAAFDLQGAFNDLAVMLQPGASAADVIDEIDRLTAAYGGTGAYDRQSQLSNRHTTDAILQLRSVAIVPPIIFLAVSAFLVHMVLSRLIGTQREQIAALKAFGYTGREIGGHYLRLVLIIVLVGTTAGAVIGQCLAGVAATNYEKVYRFPSLVIHFEPRIVLTALLVTACACIAGAFDAVRRVVRLPPAEAMRPEAPASFRPTLVESLGLAHWFSQPMRMILRQLKRHPFKALLACLGIALGTAVMILGSFIQDAIDYVVQYEFYQTRRQNVTLNFVDVRPPQALNELRRWPGVLRCEPVRTTPVRLQMENRWRRVALTGLAPRSDLFRPLDEHLQPLSNLRQGLALSIKLAEVLDARLGDTLAVEVLEGMRPVRNLMVTALVKDYSGLNAYVEAETLHRMLDEGACCSGALLSVDATQLTPFCEKVKATPRVASATIRSALLRSFHESEAKNLTLMRVFNMMFASIIAFGVVYNTAHISLAERKRELATMRVLGFSRGEVAQILLGELALLTLVAIPIGLAMGRGFAAISVWALNTESQRIPLVVSPATCAAAVATIVFAAAVSALVVRRQLDRLELLEILKARD
ncbi:MAG TPA: ABC transporter permease [Pirellulales bacterium]|nr:ABC transporter permease [Pirellulales bacterium]